MSKVEIEIIGNNIFKAYSSNKYILKNISFEGKNGDIIGICGPNGSGKSTLVKIIAGINSTTKGSLIWEIDGKQLNQDEYFSYFGFVAPYLNIYEEFTPVELIKITSSIRRISVTENKTNELLELFYLEKHYNKYIRNFSSGMKQRMKLLLSVLHSPAVLIYDEPTTNLDDIGIQLVKRLIKEKVDKDGIVFLASNNEEELRLCNKKIFVNNVNKEL